MTKLLNKTEKKAKLCFNMKRAEKTNNTHQDPFHPMVGAKLYGPAGSAVRRV